MKALVNGIEITGEPRELVQFAKLFQEAEMTKEEARDKFFPTKDFDTGMGNPGCRKEEIRLAGWDSYMKCSCPECLPNKT